MAIEDADGFGFAGHAVGLGAKLPVHVGTQAEEMIFAVVLGDVGADLQGLSVFQEHDRPGDRRSIGAQNGAFNGSSSGSTGLANDGRLGLCKAEGGRD